MRGEKTKQLWENPEYRKRMSEAHKGIKMPPFTQEHKDKIRKTLTGVPHSPERRANASKGKRGKPRPYQRGEKSRFWKGGITALKLQIKNLLQYQLWRTAVYTRDDYTCVFCGVRGGRLEADHIKPFSTILHEHNVLSIEQAVECAELWDINNGRTLCRPCHKETPTYGGKSRIKI